MPVASRQKPVKARIIHPSLTVNIPQTLVLQSRPALCIPVQQYLQHQLCRRRQKVVQIRLVTVHIVKTVLVRLEAALCPRPTCRRSEATCRRRPERPRTSCEMSSTELALPSPFPCIIIRQYLYLMVAQNTSRKCETKTVIFFKEKKNQI